MKKILDRTSLACLGIGVLLTVIILFLRSPDLFTALIVVNGIGFISLTTMVTAEKNRVLRKEQARTLTNRSVGMMSQLLTAIAAIIFDTATAIFMPPLLFAVTLSARWISRRIIRAWRGAWWRNRSLQ